MEKAIESEKQIEIYSRILWDASDLVELRTLPAGGLRFWEKAINLSSRAKEIAGANEEKLNIYTGVLPRSEKKGTAEFCLPGFVVWADFDNGIEAREAWKKVKGKNLPDPTLVVNSGHGTHLFWKLKKKEPPEILSRIVKDFAVFFESDISVSDPARILRLPGFTNWKDPVAKAEIKFHSEIDYEFEELRKLIPEGKIEQVSIPRISKTSCEPMIERARRYVSMIPGQSTGGRTKTAYQVACVLVRDFELGEHDAISLLSGWDSAANQPPIQGDTNYAQNELEKIIRHAQKYGKKPYGELANKETRKGKSPEAEMKLNVKSELIDETAEMCKSLESQEQGKSQTISLPWVSLSAHAKAVRPGAVVVIAGPLKTGKSYFAINILAHFESLKIPWRYLPLEDSREDFKWRLLAVVADDYRATDIDKEGVEIRMEMLKKHNELIQKMSGCVQENPRIGHRSEQGETIIPIVTPESVIEWARAALKNSRVIFIDPISQIDFPFRDQHLEEANFVRKLLATAKDSGGTIILIAHTVKRPGRGGEVPITAEDVQGSAMLTRLCHTTILIDRHEEKEVIVTKFGVGTLYNYKRTVTIAATRNGPGGVKLAFDQGQWGPKFTEYGLIANTKKEKKRK